jgi:hypothetical protein
MNFKSSLIGVLIFVVIFTACTKKSETQTHHADEHEGGPSDDYEALPPGFGYPYTAILEGDLSNFAGTWVNGQGSRMVLTTNGTFGEGSSASFRRQENGSYTWGISFASGGGNGVVLYPVGVDVNERPGQTDTTKVRILIITSGDSAYNPDEFYYREGEGTSSSTSSHTIQIGFSGDRNLAFWIIHNFDDGDSLARAIAITSEITLRNFSFLAVHYNYEDDSWAVERILYRIPELKSSQQMEAFQANIHLGEGLVPTRGISYMDGNIMRYFFISESGYDDSITLTEFHPH